VRPRIVILGGGFAGIGAARKLANADLDVVLVDKHDYHTFQPLLYQVATDLLETEVVGHPLRDLFDEHPNLTVHEAAVTGIDLASREVQVAGTSPLPYDYLVLALGAEVNFFGVEGALEHAFPMYTLADAVRLKEHVSKQWAAADRDPGLVEDGVLNVVVVGGGPTGVETAGAMAELYRSSFARDYPGLPQAQARIVLVEAAPSLFAMFKPSLQAYAKKELEKRGVEVLLEEIVASIEPTRVTLESGAVLDAHTLVWGAGLQANPIAQSLGVELQRGGRVAAEPDLSLAGHLEVFPVGDIAWITDTKTGEVLPQLGSVALQAGQHAGENIALLAAGKATKPFRYFDKGTMATIGHGSAVIQMPRGRTLKGRAAWLAWGSIHLALLASGEDRAKAMADWTWEEFTKERPGRVAVGTEEVG
jgi:NADH:ubiquinone reductase (H+-translocating)